MRVIAGTYRSRLLQAPRGLDTRPTSDRLRETLFNVIAARVPGSCFADLYAGSGAVGIEAISRAAAHVTFAEIATPALAAIRANLRTLGIASGYRVESGGVAPLLRSSPQRPFDVVFLDPPYDDHDAYGQALASLGRPAGALLNPGAVIIAEHRRKQPLEERYGLLERTRTLVQGDAALSFYSLSASLSRMGV